MRLILVGPPGSGKGTQAKLLADRLGLLHISTGDILRDAIKRGTPAGKKAEPFVTSGGLVPDELVNELVADRFRRVDRPERFILDGYPRTVAQAEVLDTVLARESLGATSVVVLMVDDDEIVTRLSKRGRADDLESTVRHRLQVYHDTTARIVAYYQKQGLVQEVPGTGDIEAIYSRIVEALQART